MTMPCSEEETAEGDGDDSSELVGMARPVLEAADEGLLVGLPTPMPGEDEDDELLPAGASLAGAAEGAGELLLSAPIRMPSSEDSTAEGSASELCSKRLPKSELDGAAGAALSCSCCSAEGEPVSLGKALEVDGVGSSSS